VALLVPILSLGIPIFDTALAFTRRLAEGKHPFQADRRHLHHRLLDRGLNQRSTVLTLYAVSAVLSALAIFMTNASRIGAFAVLAAVGVAGVVAVRRLGLEEFRELARKFRYGERRRRPPRAKAMLVRNSLPMLRRVESRQALEVLLEDIRRTLGFVEVTVRLDERVAPPFLDGDPGITVTGQILAGGIIGSVDPDERKWTATVEILPPDDDRGWSTGENGEPMTCLGTVTVVKPEWMCRRKSDNDLELLTWLADGLGAWLSNPGPAHLQGWDATKRDPSAVNR
jgi:hypothetical protein